MRGFVARIALLIYVVGGLAVPAMHHHGHRHTPRLLDAHHSEFNCGAHACHVSAEAIKPTLADDTAAAEDRDSLLTLVDADGDSSADIDHLCVICAFSAFGKSPVVMAITGSSELLIAGPTFSISEPVFESVLALSAAPRGPPAATC